MPYAPFPFDTFGRGLNLKAKADSVEPGDAIDAMNVEFTTTGAVQQRSGYEELTGTALTNRATSLHPYYRTTGANQLLAGCGTRLEGISVAGAVVDSETGLTSGTWDFARFGTPNSEVAYAGQGTDTLRKWDASTWTAPTATVDGVAARAMPKAGALATLTTSNRLAASRFATTTGGPHGQTSSPSHIYFSEEGDAEAWDTTNLIQLTPGDGEAIQALVSYRELLFAFKETKFFVFYGESIDNDGGVIFDFRPVDTGIGMVGPKAYCVTEQGIYFVSPHGVYLTNGGEPVEVSDAVQPIFEGGSSAFYTGGELNHTLISSVELTALDERLYLAFSTGGTYNDRMLVYDTTDEWWSLWDIPAAAMTSFEIGTRAELVFSFATGNNEIGRINSTETNDNGAAITSRWRSGWFDMGTTINKRVREWKVWGSGVVTTSLSVDYEQSVGYGRQLDMTDPAASTWGGTTWGGGTWASPDALVPRLARRANRGTRFSLAFQNSTLNQEWAVHRTDLHIAGERFPTVRRTDKVAA